MAVKCGEMAGRILGDKIGGNPFFRKILKRF